MDALPAIVAEKLGEVRALCEKYRVKRLTLFGSAVKGTFDPEKSDLDFVVEFEWDPDPLERGRLWLELWDELRELFRRNVDLLVASTIKSRYLQAQIDLAHLDLYAA